MCLLPCKGLKCKKDSSNTYFCIKDSTNGSTCPDLSFRKWKLGGTPFDLSQIYCDPVCEKSPTQTLLDSAPQNARECCKCLSHTELETESLNYSEELKASAVCCYNTQGALINSKTHSCFFDVFSWESCYPELDRFSSMGANLVWII